MDHEFRSAEERRAAIVALTQKETGIDEGMIKSLIRGFYARVRKDPLLAPVFELRISDWEPHLENMFAFWSSLTLMTGRYHGQPMAKHLALPVDAIHFDRWLALFDETARELCPPAAAERFIERARRVAESLELGVAGANGSPAWEGRALSYGGLAHLSENNVSRTLPLSPMMHTSVCGLVVLVRST